MAEVLIIEHEERSSDASNDVGMEYQAEKQGNALQWLSENRQLNDLQLFAHVSAEVQLSLAVALRTDRIGFPEGSNALGKHHGRRPAKEIDIGHVEVFPRSASETPGLLSELNRTIAAATYAATDCAAPSRRRGLPGSAATPHPLGPEGVASNLGLQIHSAALDHFIEGFPTYAGILKEIKREFEAALNRVVVFARDNVQLRQQRTADKAARGEAVDKAYKKGFGTQQHNKSLLPTPPCQGNNSDRRVKEVVVQAASVAGDFRRTVHKKLIAMEERQIAAERRTQAAKQRMQLISSDVEAARAHVARLVAINLRLKGTTKSEEEWSKKGRRAALKGVVLGPISLEMERALDPDAIPAAVMRKSVLKVSNTLKLSPRNVLHGAAEHDAVTEAADNDA